VREFPQVKSFFVKQGFELISVPKGNVESPFSHNLDKNLTSQMETTQGGFNRDLNAEYQWDGTLWRFRNQRNVIHIDLPMKKKKDKPDLVDRGDTLHPNNASSSPSRGLFDTVFWSFCLSRRVRFYFAFEVVALTAWLSCHAPNRFKSDLTEIV